MRIKRDENTQQMYKEIGLKLNKLRTDNNMTINALAKALNMSDARVQRYLYHYRNPTIPFEVIKRCADIFNVTIDELTNKE